eukprot:756323-Hanusia_phi.AAC.5
MRVHSPKTTFRSNFLRSLKSQAGYLEEEVWRPRAAMHRKRVYELLSPGFLKGEDKNENSERAGKQVEFAALDPYNPIYNFLLEYYNVRGRKGTRKLARWSPGFNALLCSKGTFVTHDETGKRGLVYNLQELKTPDELATFNWYKSILASTAANAPGDHFVDLPD